MCDWTKDNQTIHTFHDNKHTPTHKSLLMLTTTTSYFENSFEKTFKHVFIECFSRCFIETENIMDLF